MFFMDLEVGEFFYVLNDKGNLASDALYEKIPTFTLDMLSGEKVLPSVGAFGEANAIIAKSRNIKGSQNENLDGYFSFIPPKILVLPYDKVF